MPAAERVEPVPAAQLVVAAAAKDQVPSDATAKDIVATEPRDAVVAGTGRNHVAVRRAAELVRTYSAGSGNGQAMA